MRLLSDLILYMLLIPPEMDIEFMEVLQEGAERRTLGHFGEGIHILGEALAAISELPVGTRDIGMGVVDITREENACMDSAPVGPHLLAVFTTGVEEGNLIGPEYVMHVFGQLGLQRRHDGKLLAHKDLRKQLMLTGEDDSLLPEVL